MPQKKTSETLYEKIMELRTPANFNAIKAFTIAILTYRHLSLSYEIAAKKELNIKTTLKEWYRQNTKDVKLFETQMKKKTNYIIKPEHSWISICHTATHDTKHLTQKIKDSFNAIENNAYDNKLTGLLSYADIDSSNLNATPEERRKTLRTIIETISTTIPNWRKIPKDECNWLVERLKPKQTKDETPQSIATILANVVAIDLQNNPRKNVTVLDFSCTTGTILSTIKNEINQPIGLYGSEPDTKLTQLAKMNMLLQDNKLTDFTITKNNVLTEALQDNKQTKFDFIMTTPPFSQKWNATDTTLLNDLFKQHNTKTTADCEYIWQGLNRLKDTGLMAIILPVGILFRDGIDKQIRTELVKNNTIEAIISMPCNLFERTGIPTCILILKKKKETKNILLINAENDVEKTHQKNKLNEEHINKIINTYNYNKTHNDDYAKTVSQTEIKKHDFNLNFCNYFTNNKIKHLI